MDNQQLIFVYNADANLFSTVVDFAHKILSASTYQCSLCALTFGNFSIKQEWKSYIERLPVSTIFLHKDEFEKQYEMLVDLPVVLIETNNSMNIILNKEEIDSCTSLQQLKDKLSSKLSAHDQHHHTNL
jgi:hypothetical protein